MLFKAANRSASPSWALDLHQETFPPFLCRIPFSFLENPSILYNSHNNITNPCNRHRSQNLDEDRIVVLGVVVFFSRSSETEENPARQSPSPPVSPSP
jgi:hypothetical protein